MSNLKYSTTDNTVRLPSSCIEISVELSCIHAIIILGSEISWKIVCDKVVKVIR